MPDALAYASMLNQVVRFLARKGYRERLSVFFSNLQLAWNEREDGSGATKEDGIAILRRAAVRGLTLPGRRVLKSV